MWSYPFVESCYHKYVIAHKLLELDHCEYMICHMLQGAAVASKNCLQPPAMSKSQAQTAIYLQRLSRVLAYVDMGHFAYSHRFVISLLS